VIQVMLGWTGISLPGNPVEWWLAQSTASSARFHLRHRKGLGLGAFDGKKKVGNACGSCVVS